MHMQHRMARTICITYLLCSFSCFSGDRLPTRIGSNPASSFGNWSFYGMRDWGNVGTVVAVKKIIWSETNGCVCVPGFFSRKSCIFNEFREAIDCSRILLQLRRWMWPQGSFNGGHCEFSHIKVSLANKCFRIGADSCKQIKDYRFNCSERTYWLGTSGHQNFKGRLNVYDGLSDQFQVRCS